MRRRSGVLLLSLGVSGAMAGLVGVGRGPGLRLFEGGASGAYGMGGSPAGSLIPIGGAVGVLVLAAAWAGTREGLRCHLLGQNREFGAEIGTGTFGAGGTGVAMVALCAGWAGWAEATTVGSTPEAGMSLSLLGIMGAFCLPGVGIWRAVLGGGIVGALEVALQLVLSPALSTGVLFAGMGFLMLVRRTSRGVQGVR